MYMDHNLHLGTLLSDDKPKMLPYTNEYNLARGFHLVHHIEAIRWDDHEGQLANKSIQKVTKGTVRAFGGD